MSCVFLSKGFPLGKPYFFFMVMTYGQFYCIWSFCAIVIKNWFKRINGRYNEVFWVRRGIRIVSHKNPPNMKTVLLLKSIYLESIKNISNYLIRNYFRVFTWFTIVLLLIVAYAFLYRIFTGFPFQ